MKLKTTYLLQIVVCLIVFLVTMGCENTKTDDNDDNSKNDSGNSQNNDGWSDDSCLYEWEGAPTKSGSQDCEYPSLPEPGLQIPLDILLDAYLGNYENKAKEIVIISCDPDGKWILPYYFPEGTDPLPPCDAYYSLPISITIGEQPEIFGKITNGAGESTEIDPLTVPARMDVQIGDEFYHGGRAIDDNSISWNFEEGWDTWTKL